VKGIASALIARCLATGVVVDETPYDP